MQWRHAARVGSIVFALTLHSAARSANDVWDNNPGGNWANGANWADGTTPGNGDTATFNLAQAYNVTFSAPPAAIQNLTVSAGTVTFVSSGGVQTLSVNSTTAALGNDLNLSGATTTLNLGTSSNPLNLTLGDDLSVQGGAILEARFGSDIAASDLSASGLNGTLRIDGVGSTLALNALASHLVANTAAGSLLFQNGSVGNSISGALRIADGAAGVTGNLSITGGSSLTFGGLLALASQNIVNQNATLTIDGASSILTQSASSPITVGAAANGTAAVNIGVAATGGTFTTGTGLLTVNNTGVVTIGSGANTGTLNANGDVTINGGSLTRGSGSNFNLADSRTLTVQGGGSASFAGGYETASNAIYTVTGATSTLESSSGSLLIGNGAQVNVAAGGSVSAAIVLDIGSILGDGTLTVDGSGSSAVAGTGPAFWGFGNTATVTFSNNATGTFNGGIALAGSTDAGTTGDVDILSGADLSVGSMFLATDGGATTVATLDVQGSGSTVTQTAASSLIVGHESSGTAVINIGTTASGAVFTTGTGGQLTINATGTVAIGSSPNTGTLNANGNVTIDGGELIRASGSTFTLLSGRTMTIENGGAARFTGNYITAASAIYNISGAGSILETTSVGNTLSILGGATVTASAQGTVSAGGSLTVSNGTLIVDGAGSSADAGSSSQWATSGNTADITFSNGATGNFPNGVQVATSTTANTVADISVLSGADLDIGSLNLATSGGATTSATVTIDGAGSTLTPSNFNIGHSATGTAVVNVQNDGALTVDVGSGTSLNATGTINIDGGTVDLKTLTDNGGTINFTAGSLSYFGNLSVGTGGLLGEDLTLGSNHQLTLSGATTIDAGHNLTLDGGTLNTGALVVNGTLNFTAGTLGVTGAGGLTIGSGGPLGSTLTLGAGQNLNVTNTTTVNAGSLLVLENGGGFTSGTVTSSGEIVLDGPAALLQSSVLNNSGLLRGRGRIDALLNNLAGGEVRAATGELLQFITLGGSVNSGRINLLGGTVEFTQSGLTNSASGQIMGHGSLIADNIHNDGTMAFSGAANVLGDVTNDDGVIISSGGGPTTFFNDVVNDNEIRTSAGSFTVFFGSVTGAGTFTGTGTVNIEGDLSPGSSPGSIDFGGDVVLGASATLEIEIGGTTAGSEHDRIVVDGALELDGLLNVSRVNGFNPVVNDSFDILDWGSLNGAFDSITLPPLDGFVTWDTSNLYMTGVLAVVPLLPGDFNADGSVDAADYVVWRKGLGTTHTPDDFNVWRANFGNSLGSGSTAEIPPASVVPEPAAFVLIALGAVTMMGSGHRRSRRSRDYH